MESSCGAFERPTCACIVIERLVDESSRRTLIRNLAGKQQALWRELDRTLHSLLTREQFDKLETLSAQLEYVRQGPVAAMTTGALGDRLDVSGHQTKQLLEAAEQLREELTAETSKLAENALDAILSELPEQKSRLVRKRAGRPLTEAPGNITILLLDLLPQQR